MKICLYSIPAIKSGKYNIKDSRLDEVDSKSKAKKKTYIQVELVTEDVISEADMILVFSQNQSDLILKDLEFTETRLGRSEDENEKTILNKLKAILENETFIFNAGLTLQEQSAITGYPLFTNKPLVVAQEKDLENLDDLLAKCLREGGFISFFTTGERETRAWLIKKGTTAWEAAGVVHSDIQKGFIRAEIISFNDFIQAGGENQAKQAGKLHLEQKEYVMQDADLANFRFNK
jgi:ribosome-binding ATPase YchF (GTP1/OBG family)